MMMMMMDDDDSSMMMMMDDDDEHGLFIYKVLYDCQSESTRREHIGRSIFLSEWVLLHQTKYIANPEHFLTGTSPVPTSGRVDSMQAKH